MALCLPRNNSHQITPEGDHDMPQLGCLTQQRVVCRDVDSVLIPPVKENHREV